MNYSFKIVCYALVPGPCRLVIMENVITHNGVIENRIVYFIFICKL